MYEKIRDHIGHKIVCVGYGEFEGEPINVAVECETCGCVICDADKDDH